MLTRSLPRPFFAVLLVLSCCMFTGCASFKKNMLPEVDMMPVPGDGAIPEVTYSLEAKIDFMGNKEVPERGMEALQAELETTFQEAGYPVTLSGEAPHGPLHMHVGYLTTGSEAAMIPAFITGLSLYTIPSWVTEYYEIKLEVQRAGGESKVYELKDASVLVQWLPMIFAFPFKNPIKVIPDVRKNIYKNLIIQMQEDGFLPTSPSDEAVDQTSMIHVRCFVTV